jgi:hypothetical protein
VNAKSEWSLTFNNMEKSAAQCGAGVSHTTALRGSGTAGSVHVGIEIEPSTKSVGAKPS